MYTSAHNTTTLVHPHDMTFSNATLSVLVLVSLVLTVLALYVLLAPGRVRQRRSRAQSSLPSNAPLDVLVQAQSKAIKRLEGAVGKLALGEKRLGELSEDAVRHVGVVRFDAFEDMGGRLSFSAALLDGHGDGVVITSINGRQDTRCYAKQIRNATSIHNLSDEERQAIREALGGPRQIVEAS